MPIFEYRCTDCDREFEVLVLADQEVSCPDCKGSSIQKLVSACSHKSNGEFSGSSGSSCTSCSATSCNTCGA